MTPRWKRIVYVTVIFNFAGIVLLAKSSMVVLFMAITIIIYTLFNVLSLARIMVLSLAMAIASFADQGQSSFFEDIRLGKMARLLTQAPKIALEKDASLNERAAHICPSLRETVLNAGFPHGFHAFSEVLSAERNSLNTIFWWGEVHNKIMSGFGSILFELGWFRRRIYLPLFVRCIAVGLRWRSLLSFCTSAFSPQPFLSRSPCSQ